MKRKSILFFIIFLWIILLNYKPSKVFAINEQEDLITYSSHIENYGWEKDFENINGDISGFIDKELKIEAIKIKLNNATKNANILYQVHLENGGWLSYVSNGNVAGTTGRNLKIEAIRIKLEGLDNYDVIYRTYLENTGWQAWVKNDEISGTIGENKRIYAIQIKLTLKTEIGVNYYSYIQNIGWEEEYSKKDGAQSGTTGQNLRLEAIKINLTNAPIGAKVTYNSYIQNIGWQGWKNEDELAGFILQDLKIEAIKIKLIGLNGYSICYKVHIQDVGWQDWKENGEEAGIIGKNLKIEAIKIDIIKNEMPYIAYFSHIQDIGWENEFSKVDGDISGTTGKNLKVEAIKIKLENALLGAKITYQTYIQNSGWQDWKENGEQSGTTGQNLRLEAIRIKLEGLEGYTVRYRVHVQDKGWLKWVASGTISGFTNSNLKIEAIQIQIIPESEVTKEELKQEYLIKKGIDISVYQGNINWIQTSQDENVDFVMIRAGYRGYGQAGTLVTDSKFKTNIEGALKNKIEVGVYFFSQAINEQEAIQEAKYTLNLVKGYNITYPIVIDTELSSHPNKQGRADLISKEQRTAVVKAFCETVKKAGYEPMIYANKWWLTEQLNLDKLSNYPVWLAHYTGVTQDDPFVKPSNYNGKYSMWQYTDKGHVNGIVGNVDMDILY